ncbi:L,D-transpeptidase [Streptomyces sp. NPDC058691]|uniref:L,D-transpeptidase family protein n=1 Tax=Streptomyces sp. NPDC058691 TaxID=3346601 RepID=UPI003646E940
MRDRVVRLVVAGSAVLAAAAGTAGADTTTPMVTTAAAAPVPRVPPLPADMVDTGGGSQLITAVAAGTASTKGTLTWWDLRDGVWKAAGSAPARFGAAGLVEGAERTQSTWTTPTGLYDLPYAFGIKHAPKGTRMPYRAVTPDSYWCQDNASWSYNRWVEPLPDDCAASESEHLIRYRKPYAHALVIGFNYDEPEEERGAGIFLHVNGPGPTAGCVSVPLEAMRRLLAWADPDRGPHIAIGTKSGETAITSY